MTFWRIITTYFSAVKQNCLKLNKRHNCHPGLLSLAFRQIKLAFDFSNGKFSIIRRRFNKICRDVGRFSFWCAFECIVCIHNLPRTVKQSGDKYLSMIMIWLETNTRCLIYYLVVSSWESSYIQRKVVLLSIVLETDKEVLTRGYTNRYLVVMSRSIYNSRYAIFWVFGTSQES